MTKVKPKVFTQDARNYQSTYAIILFFTTQAQYRPERIYYTTTTPPVRTPHWARAGEGLDPAPPAPPAPDPSRTVSLGVENGRACLIWNEYGESRKVCGTRVADGEWHQLNIRRYETDFFLVSLTKIQNISNCLGIVLTFNDI